MLIIVLILVQSNARFHLDSCERWSFVITKTFDIDHKTPINRALGAYHKFLIVAYINISRFTEGVSTEMFQAQSGKSWTAAKKVF